MGKLWLLKMVVLAVLMSSSTVFAGLKDYPSIAVLPFGLHLPKTGTSAEGELSIGDATSASIYVEDNLVSCGEFQVYERDMLEAVLSEHNLNLSGMVDLATAQKIGKLTGVKYLVYGSIVGCSLKENEVGYTNNAVGAGAANKQHVVIANLVGKFIDVETGRIVLTARGKGSSTSTHNELQFSPGGKLAAVAQSLTEEESTSTSSSSTTSSSSDGEESSDSGDGTTSVNTNKNKTKTSNYAAAHIVKFGTQKVSEVQVHNAIGKAAYDLVGGKMGFLAKLDGAATWKPKYKKPKKKD